MKLLVAGLTIWSLVHFIPSLAKPLKQKWVSQMGENGYKMAFTALILISLALIIFGWRSSVPSNTIRSTCLYKTDTYASGFSCFYFVWRIPLPNPY